MCKYVCRYVCLILYVYVCIHVFTWIYMYMYTCILNTCIYTYVRIYIYIEYRKMYLYMYIRIWVCIHIYVHIYMIFLWISLFPLMHNIRLRICIYKLRTHMYKYINFTKPHHQIKDIFLNEFMTNYHMSRFPFLTINKNEISFENHFFFNYTHFLP
jgi:hypothetical protein